MDIKRIYSRAPTRIDLSGGTLDIWPLYLFLSKPVTINLAIDLFAEVELTSSRESPGLVVLKSEDQRIERRFVWEDLDRTDFPIPKGLELHFKLLNYFVQEKKARSRWDPQYHLELTTRARSPAGAGLGGSSSLSIALIGALATWAAESTEEAVNAAGMGEDFIQIVRDIETTVIQVPAGLQDYYAAMYGGLQKLSWQPNRHLHHALPTELISDLEDRVLLFYSGQSRNSGINNWALFKNFIDSQDAVRSKFQAISDITHDLEGALLSRSWPKVGECIRSEWKVRKTLSAGISIPEVDRAFAAVERLSPLGNASSLAMKVCGAGGGGCYFVFLTSDDPSDRELYRKQITEIFTAEGLSLLNIRGVPQGLDVRVVRD